MKRTVEMYIGDWSDDGHGKSDKIIVNIEGVDVSDEALQASYEKSKQDLGVDILKLFSSYEENTLPYGVYDKFVSAGFTPLEERDPRYYVWVDDSDVCGLQLFMWFIGQNLEYFKWQEIDVVYPCLVGGYNTIIKEEHGVSSSYGYGFFF